MATQTTIAIERLSCIDATWSPEEDVEWFVRLATELPHYRDNEWVTMTADDVMAELAAGREVEFDTSWDARIRMARRPITAAESAAIDAEIASVQADAERCERPAWLDRLFPFDNR